MNAFAKFLMIHSLGLILIFSADKSHATEGRQLDSRILTPVEGWVAPDGETESIEDKYPDLIKAFSGRSDEPILIKALEFLEENSSKIPNKEYLTLIDYGKNVRSERFYVINLRTAEIKSYYVSNGRNSDANRDGIAEQFSNREGSFMSSLGFYLAAEDYFSEKFDSQALRLEGLSQSNSLAMQRAIVIHGADYMDPDKGLYGRSLGCPALDKDVASSVINKIKDGSLILAFK